MAKELTTMQLLKAFNRDDIFLTLSREDKNRILFAYSEHYCTTDKAMTPLRWFNKNLNTLF